jgi:short-subunit dehydrogenase
MPGRSLSDTVVAVVGASGGIGAPLARRLAERGATLVIAGRDRSKLEALDLPDATLVELDLREPAAGDALVAAVRERHGGRLDGLVNAAGSVAFGLLAETDDDVIEELFRVNTLGPLWLTKRVVPLLAESKGFLVQISAIVAEKPTATMVAYSASKGAVTTADRALAHELRRDGVAVLDVRPPHTDTGLDARPIAGTAPKLPQGLAPADVAERIVAAVESGATDLAAEDFAGG